MRKGGQIRGDWWLVLTESKEKEDKSGWVHECGTEIEASKTIYSIHDGPFALSGSGKTHTEIVPYCPKCEQKPPATAIMP